MSQLTLTLAFAHRCCAMDSAACYPFQVHRSPPFAFLQTFIHMLHSLHTNADTDTNIDKDAVADTTAHLSNYLCAYSGSFISSYCSWWVRITRSFILIIDSWHCTPSVLLNTYAAGLDWTGLGWTMWVHLLLACLCLILSFGDCLVGWSCDIM